MNVFLINFNEIVEFSVMLLKLHFNYFLKLNIWNKDIKYFIKQINIEYTNALLIDS